MKFKFFLIIILLLIVIPHISALDTGNWSEITVNKVTFKIPEKFSNGTMTKYDTGYNQGEGKFFHITSLVKYETLKSIYGSFSTARGLMDIEETEIAGRDAVVIYDHNSFYNYDYLNVFFPVGKKIFRIEYPSSNVTPELKEIIKSAPKSKMSEETFFNKLDTAQRDYIREDYEKNLELDFEEYYRDYNDNRNFWYWGSNGFGIGGSW